MDGLRELCLDYMPIVLPLIILWAILITLLAGFSIYTLTIVTEELGPRYGRKLRHLLRDRNLDRKRLPKPKDNDFLEELLKKDRDDLSQK